MYISKFLKFKPFREFVCQECGKILRKAEDLMHHCQLEHEDKKYECKQCNLKMDGMEQMRQHIMRSHTFDGKD